MIISSYSVYTAKATIP